MSFDKLPYPYTMFWSNRHFDRSGEIFVREKIKFKDLSIPLRFSRDDCYDNYKFYAAKL